MADSSRTHRWLAGSAALLGTLALGTGDSRPSRDTIFVTAIDVARLARDGRTGVRIVDLRADSLFDAYHVPRAERLEPTDVGRNAWTAEDTVVLYASDDAQALDAAARLQKSGVKHVRVLRGGLVAWLDQIVQPRLATLPPTATPEEQAARREHLELSRYFGGTPYVSPDVRPATRATEAAAVARTLRRGC